MGMRFIRLVPAMENSRYRKTTESRSAIQSQKKPVERTAGSKKSKKEGKPGWMQRFRDKMRGSRERPSKESARKPSKERIRTDNNRAVRTRETQEEVSRQPPSQQQNSAEKIPVVRKMESKEKISVSKEKVKQEASKMHKPPPQPKATGHPPMQRKRPSFQHDKKVKTVKDIQDELAKAKDSKMGNLNSLVGTNERKYEKKEMLAKGKRGNIFRVQDMKPGSEENKLIAKMSDCREAVNNEIRFLLEFQQTLRDQVFGADHILSICSYGAFEEYSWFIQPQCGPNLDQLRQQMDAEFSCHTALRLGLMALDAIACLHRCEVMHGRIEPQHFVIGCDTLKSNLFLVGLGHIVQAGSSQTFVWNKTPAYSPSRTYRNHFNTEIETWLYLLLDLYGRSHLPWNKRRWTPEEIQKWKEQIFMFPVLLPVHFPPLFHDLFMIIAKWDDSENSAIRAIRRRLLDHFKQEKISRQTPFEWEWSELEKESMKKAKDPGRSRSYLQKAKALHELTKKLLQDYHSNDAE